MWATNVSEIVIKMWYKKGKAAHPRLYQITAKGFQLRTQES